MPGLKWLGGGLLLLCAAAHAEQSFEFDDYIVHYIAMPTAELPAEVARAYGVTRSTKRGLLVLNVQHRERQLTGLSCKVEGTIKNLMGQPKSFEPREFSEQDAVYTLVEFKFSNLETLTFDLDIRPSGSTRSGRLRFSQKFWVN